MVYRYEQVDARHETQFDQIEGLAVGPGITFSDLKGTLADLARRLVWAECPHPLPGFIFPVHRTERRV